MRKAAGLCLVLLAITACSTKRSYLEKGNALFDQGKYDEAALTYQKAIQKDRNYGEGYYRLGLTGLKQNNVVLAYNALLRATQLLPDNVEVKEKFAGLCLDTYLKDPRHPQNLYGQIQQAVSELLAKNPKSFEGLRIKGSLEYADRKPEEAIADFQTALQVQPGNAQVTAALVQTLVEEGRYPEAERTALELVSRDKTYGPIYDILYGFYVNAGRPADAEHIVKLKVTNNPKRASYIIQLAAHYARVQKPTEMREALQTLLDNPKDFPNAQLLVGDFYLGLPDYPQAIRYYEAAQQGGNLKDKVGLEKKALVAMLAGSKFDDATRLVDQILKEAPGDEVALRLRADLLINTGKPENGAAAAQILRGLLNAHPNEPDAALRLNLGRAYRLKGDLAAARSEFEEALRQRKDFPAAQFELGKLYAAQRRPQEALAAANAAVALTPASRRARLLQAWTMANTGQVDKARTVLDQLIKESPKDTQALYQRGLLALQQRKYLEAIGTLEDLRDSGVPSAIAALAAAYAGQRQFDKAQTVLSEALKQSPGSLPLRVQLARTMALAGDYNLAIEQYQKLIVQDPKSAPFQLGMGEVYQAKGDLKSALVFYNQAHALAPDELTPALVLADTLALAERNEDAKALYLQIVRAHPDDPPALNNAAFFLCDHGDLDQAQRLAEKALEKVPGQPGFSDTLGYVYLKRGQQDAAIRTFSDLVRRYPTLSVFHYHLALALYGKGDRVAAKKELQKALADHPESTIEPRIRTLLNSLG
ncbi:MAG: tetratricopeptide repeat protein [Bryobacteraceae bacterium]